MMYRPPRDTSLALILNFWPISALMSNSILLSVNRSITQRYHPERAARCQGTWGAVASARVSDQADALHSCRGAGLVILRPVPADPDRPSRLPSLSRISAPPRDNAIRPSEVVARAAVTERDTAAWDRKHAGD
jgi:hypothetical protein